MSGSSPLCIAGRQISVDNPPYVIAELSANHNGSLETALKLIECASEAGADAVKLQTYTADTITLNSDSDDFQIHGGLWDGKTLYQLYQEAHMPWEWHEPLFEQARSLGITIFSSPFDTTAVDYLENLNVPAYKVASFELTDHSLIRYMASTGKPLILSTGMANLEEIEEAVQVVRDAGCKNFCLLHCVSGYPAPPSDYNLATIPDMARHFGVPVGLSDHTIDNTTAITSVAFGASVIEKHFTLDRQGGGPDDSFSLEPPELAQLCTATRSAWQAGGKVNYERKSSEVENAKFRRSLYFVKDLAAGEVITKDAVRTVRPGFGLPPKYFDQLVGRKVAVDVVPGTACKWEILMPM